MVILKRLNCRLYLIGIFYFIILNTTPNPLFSQTLSDLYIPTVFPDRINLTVTEDPSSSMAVTWRTDISMDTGVAEIVVASADPRMMKNAIQIPARTETLFSKDGTYKELNWDGVVVNYHSVLFKNLEPGTLYNYRVGGEGKWSEWFQFKTAGKAGKKLTFLYFGDVQSGIRSMWSKVIRQAYADAPDAGVMLYAGDIVNRGNRDVEWGELFGAGSFIFATIPSIFSPGNHDYGRGSAALQLSSYWRPQFTLPDNGPKGLKETCYFTDIQGVRFISLDSYVAEDMVQDMPPYDDTATVRSESDEYIRRQRVWLDSVLSHNPNRWTILVFHHPIFSPKSSRDNKRMREAFKPLIDKYKVDLVLQGHDHSYARGMRKIPMKKKAAKSGTMYVVSVAGPKFYGQGEERKPWISKSILHKQLYQVITIDDDSLKFRTYNSNGELADAFDLIKRKGQINKLVNKM